jgi:2-dehydro-3-deoxy-D-arabinonate dehydratase
MLVRTRDGFTGWATPEGLQPVEDALRALEEGGPRFDHADLPANLVFPVEPPEVWCAGVTYERSREARLAESQMKDVYNLVYTADRPELFFKDAACRRTVGPEEPISVRSDSSWTVPEPELALVLGRSGRILGATAGNDITARDIEGLNPLYLPQAKIFAGACSLGPVVLTPDEWPAAFEISCRILTSDGKVVWAAEVSTERMQRSLDDLVAWLTRDNPIPSGTVLLTGTGLVPPDGVTLLPGQRVEVSVSEIGTLANPVVSASSVAEYRGTNEHR